MDQERPRRCGIRGCPLPRGEHTIGLRPIVEPPSGTIEGSSADRLPVCDEHWSALVGSFQPGERLALVRL